MQIATSKNLTVLGILTILGAVTTALVAVFDGDPATNISWELTMTGIVTGIGMILAKGQANTGGTVPSTPEAVARLTKSGP